MFKIIKKPRRVRYMYDDDSGSDFDHQEAATKCTQMPMDIARYKSDQFFYCEACFISLYGVQPMKGMRTVQRNRSIRFKLARKSWFFECGKSCSAAHSKCACDQIWHNGSIHLPLNSLHKCRTSGSGLHLRQCRHAGSSARSSHAS